MAFVSRVPRLLALVVALLAVPLLTGAAGPAGSPTGPAPAASPPTFTVDGQVARPLTMSVDELRRFPARHEVVGYIAQGKREVHRFRGALLVDVLNAAQPRFNPATKHDELRHAILVAATDGYQTVLSWGELDPDIAGTEVLLATQQDGHPLARPRLVVPGDKEGARYVTDVDTVSLLRVGG